MVKLIATGEFRKTLLEIQATFRQGLNNLVPYYILY
jgi:hypothetical protein